MEIVAENLVKKFGSFRALENITFKINGKGCFGYLGPNGAGKTTTMKIFTSLIRPSSGIALIDGISVVKDPVGALKRVGSLIEDPEPYGYMSVKEFIDYAVKIRNKSFSEFQELKEKLDLPDPDKRCSKLSKGQKRRVFIAAIIAQEPEIMILDEPSAGLDPAEAVVFRNIILELKKDRMIFLSSHLLHEVSQVCDYVFFINKGKIVGQGSIDEIKRKFSSNALRIEFTSTVNDDTIAGIVAKGLANSYRKEGEDTYIIEFDGKDETRKKILEELLPLGIRSVSDAKLGLEQAYLELILGKKEE